MSGNRIENATNCPQMDPKAFQEFGYLQEVNRMFFHPLGLALGIAKWTHSDAYPNVVGGGTPRASSEWVFVVFDSRDDPEGVRFEGFDLTAKADRVAQEWQRRREARESALGYQIQPALTYCSGPDAHTNGEHPGPCVVRP